MSRDSPRRGLDSPFRNSVRSRRDSGDEFVDSFSRMLIQRDEEFNRQQDYETEKLQFQLAQDLEESIQRHEAVRLHAQNVLEQYRQELHRAEQERVALAQQQKSQEAELARQREAEIRRREQEHAELLLQEEQKRAEDAEKLRRTRETAEQFKKQREEAETRQKQEEAAAAAAAAATPASPQIPSAQGQQNGTSVAQKPTPAQQPAPTAQQLPQAQTLATATMETGLTSSIPERDATHQKYLALHKRLKKMRTQIKTAGQSIKEWRDKRLTIKKLLGQLANENGDGLNEMEKRNVRTANLQRRKEIIAILQGAQRAPGPTLDARDYIVDLPATLTSLAPAAAQVPAVFIYLLNMCSKSAIDTIKKTAPAVTESVGITIAFVFGSLDLRFHGASFIDILLAKYRFVCPILFGIYGPDNTQRGRLRLGWPNDELDNGKRAWIDEKTFFEEQQYLAVGWAALTLRDFKKAKTSNNACPPWNYWKSVACIINTPPEQVTRLHFVVLKNLLENHADKFIKFYGQAATVALRTAIVIFPSKQGAKQTTERNGLEFLKDGLKRHWGIIL
jgi:nucleoporin GLE1